MRWRLLALALALACLPPCRPAQGHQPDEVLRLVVVHSYHPEFVWCRNISQGVRDGLVGLKTDITEFYMDAKRQPDRKRLEAEGHRIAAEIARLAPQVVIAVDDLAQLHLVTPHLKDKGPPQVVFCGVNAPPELYGYPASNVSGVRERWHFREGFALLKKIRPALRSVAVLVDDSESGGYVLDDLRDDQMRNGPFALELIGVDQAHSFQEWQTKVRALQKRAGSLALGLYHSLVDETTGRVVPAETVAAWNKSVLRKPTLGFMDFAVDHGLLCGVLESGHEQGLLAGQMARTVFERRVAAGKLPVRINQRGVILVNLKTSERLGITIPYEIIRAAGVVVQ